MPDRVLDSTALFWYLKKSGPKHTRVKALIEKRDRKKESLYLHSANLLEIYSKTYRQSGLEEANQLLRDIRELPIEVVETIDDTIIQEAGRLKAIATTGFPWADAVAAALANVRGIELVTADRTDFGPMENSGNLRVYWL